MRRGPGRAAPATEDEQEEEREPAPVADGSKRLPPRLRPATVAAATGGGLWHDLTDACPCGLPSKTIVLKVISLLSSVVVFVALPAMRVDNGSVDSCDPLTTYGEISDASMRALADAAGGGDEGGTFLDIGSGHGRFVLWACRLGGFGRCIGIEVQKDRHEVAAASLATAASGSERVSLVLGDVRDHREVFQGLRLAYWNNLCFPTEVAEAVAAHFAATAPEGAELWSLAPLPGGVVADGERPGVERAEADIELMMDWRDEPYRPFRYRRVGPAATSA